MTIDETMAEAVEHHRAGRSGEAAALYRQVIAARPKDAEALRLLGMVEMQGGRAAAAIELLERAAEAQPGGVQYHVDLGYALAAAGRIEEAMGAYRRGLAVGPESVEAHYNLGNALRRCGRAREAAGEYRQALALRPALYQGWNNLGAALVDLGQLDEAIAAFRRALTERPDHFEARKNLSDALLKAGRYEDATAEYRHVLALRGDVLDARLNLGSALFKTGRVGDAIREYEAALAMSPEDARAHFNRGLALLLSGDFERGLPEHEWRWRAKETGLIGRNFGKPLWDGSELDGRGILLHAEQGLGDAVQFLRFVPMVAARGGRVILEVQPALRRLAEGLAGAEWVIAGGEAWPEFDLHCPLMSLPLAMGTTLATIPADVPYVRAEAEIVEKWRGRMAGAVGRKIGLAWSGSAEFRFNAERSMALRTLSPLADVAGVTFYSLQKGPAAEQVKSDSGLAIVDWTDELTDLAETAGLMANLDLIITVDTSVAHLAGAMGRPAWLMAQFVPDWRWLMGREDSPWYPTLRIFRQERASDWGHVVASIARELR